MYLKDCIAVKQLISVTRIIRERLMVKWTDADSFALGSVAKKLIKQNRCVIIKKKYWS